MDSNVLVVFLVWFAAWSLLDLTLDALLPAESKVARALVLLFLLVLGVYLYERHLVGASSVSSFH